MKPPVGMVDFEEKMTSLTSDTPRTSLARDVRLGPFLAGAVLLIILLWLYWPWFLAQFRKAIEEQADWGHLLVIPFISGYFVYLNRDKLLQRPFRTAWSGLVLVVMGMAIYFFCVLGSTAWRHANIMGFGVWLTIAGLTLLFFGWRAMKWLWFPLVFWLMFGQYISERLLNIVTFRMQDVTARGAYVVLGMFLDLDRHGNTITIYTAGVPKPLNIAEACSGMRMLMAFLAMGVTMAYIGLKHNWQRVALVAMAFPTAIFVNVLRVVTLGLLSLVSTDFTAGDFHSFIGLLWLVPAFMIFMGLMWIIGKLVVDQPAGKPKAATAVAIAEHRPTTS